MNLRNWPKKSQFLPLPTLQSTQLGLRDMVGILGMDIGRDLNRRKYIVLNRVRRFFAAENVCLLYKIQVHACVEYCSNLCDGSAQYLHDALDRLHRWVVRIFNSTDVTKSLEPLQFQRDITSLAVRLPPLVLWRALAIDPIFSIPLQNNTSWTWKSPP